VGSGNPGTVVPIMFTKAGRPWLAFSLLEIPHFPAGTSSPMKLLSGRMGLVIYLGDMQSPVDVLTGSKLLWTPRFIRVLAEGVSACSRMPWRGRFC